jgi:hypothetical protein
MRSPGRATALPGEEEPEPSQTGLRRSGENLSNRHREANVTAPLLDSTQRTATGEVKAVRGAPFSVTIKVLVVGRLGCVLALLTAVSVLS